jgi:hypothetical protein
VVRPRPRRCHADSFTARPIIPLGGGLLIVAVGVARAFILAICVRIELRTIAGFGNHRLRQNRRCGQARQHGHRAKKFERRHGCFSAVGRDRWIRGI